MEQEDVVKKLEELTQKLKQGEILDYENLIWLAQRHYKWSNISFPDFDEMVDEYNTKYPIRKQRISALKWQANEFEKRISDLNPHNPIEKIMIDDWNFSKKCHLLIEQLEEEEVLSKPRIANDAIGGIIVPAEGSWQKEALHTLPDLGDLEDMIEDAKLSYTEQLENYRMAYKQWKQNRHLFREYPNDLSDCYFDEGYGEECLILIKHVEALRDDKIKETQLSLSQTPQQESLEEEPVKFMTNLKKEQLERVHDILSEDLKYLSYNKEAWLYWFGKEQKPKAHILEWKKKNGKQALADIIHMLTIENSNKRPIIEMAFGIPNFKTSHRKEKEYDMYQNKDSLGLYDLLKNEGIL